MSSRDILKSARVFSARVSETIFDVFDLRGPNDTITRRNIRRWLEDSGTVFYRGMVSGNKKAAYRSFEKVRKFVRRPSTMAVFEELYQTEVVSLSAADLTRAAMLRRSLADRFGKDYDKFYREYDVYSRTNLGKSLQAVKQEFLQTAIARDNLWLIDKSGRTWDPRAYAEMWARTRQAEIADVYMRSEMTAFGLDLVQITRVNDTCPTCQQYDGRTFSLTGKTPGFPVLDVAPPFHPNCLHEAIAVKPELKEKYMQSNDKLEKVIQKEQAGWTEAERRQYNRHITWNKNNRF